jgi:hypothetical protein
VEQERRERGKENAKEKEKERTNEIIQEKKRLAGIENTHAEQKNLLLFTAGFIVTVHAPVSLLP